MKKIILALVALLTLGGKGFSQTMQVTQGQVTTLYSVASVGDIGVSSQTEGYLFSFNGGQFTASEDVSIIVDDTEITPATVSVTYADAGAKVVVSGDVAPYLSISAQGNTVSILADATLATEITYVLTGSSSNGSFYMDGPFKSTLELRDLSLTNPDSAAIAIDCGKRIKVNVPDGTATTLADGAGGTHKACFFINGHAEFSGGGMLTIAGSTKHAYASDEYTLFDTTFGTLNVTSALSDGLHIQQYLDVQGGTLNISGTQGDCIDVGITKDVTDEFNGQVFVSGGQLTLAVAANDVKGLKCDSAMTLSGGAINAEVSGLGTKGISVGTDLLVSNASGSAATITMNVTGTTYMPGDATLESKCRGMKIKGNYTLNGGVISMSVTGQKAKGISCDGTYTYVSGKTNVVPE